MGITQKKGFSFIELVVVIGVLLFALPTLFAIFFLILQQQMRIIRLTEVKRQGVYVSNILNTLVRNSAEGIYTAINGTEVCSSSQSLNKTYGPNTLYFKDRLNNWFYFSFASPNIASNSSITGATSLVDTSKVRITSFSSQCSLTGFASPFVTMTYNICYNVNGACGTGADTIALDFQTYAPLRPR